jgi:hypothetical protein
MSFRAGCKRRALVRTRVVRRAADEEVLDPVHAVLRLVALHFALIDEALGAMILRTERLHTHCELLTVHRARRRGTRDECVGHSSDERRAYRRAAAAFISASHRQDVYLMMAARDRNVQAPQALTCAFVLIVRLTAVR